MSPPPHSRRNVAHVHGVAFHLSMRPIRRPARNGFTRRSETCAGRPPYSRTRQLLPAAQQPGSKMKKICNLALVAAFCAGPAAGAPLAWSGWDGDLFARAKAEKRFVILDLEAVWCHWCHVMDQTTYADPAVDEFIGEKYIAARVDQDANPDLSSRYGDWGWPATIIFAPDGTEIVKLRGYIEPQRMKALLQAVIDDPTPGPSVGEEEAVEPAATAFLDKDLRAALMKSFNQSYDSDHGGWGGGQHFIDAGSMDLDMELAEAGDKQAQEQARKTFDAALALIDPVWGGVYQYSATPDWKTPHFEKIMSFQAQYLRQYAQAYAQWRDPRYLAAAKAIESYVTTFLRAPEGAFYVSQDADLNAQIDGHEYYALDRLAREKLGLPRIDKHLYARENGWAIAGLVGYSNATGDARSLQMAERAARWVLANRALPGGGFRHDDKDRGGPFLGDTLAMGQAFLDLYTATGGRDWLRRAAQAGDFIGAKFKIASGGFAPTQTAEAGVGVFKRPDPQFDDQTQVARFMNLLDRYTGQARFKKLASGAMRYAVGAAGDSERPLAGLLLADDELSHEPAHITILGRKDDPAARDLHAAALALPLVYERIDWWDTREGPLDNPDVTYPEMDRAAAFACAHHICSLPVVSAADLSRALATMAQRRTSTAR